MSLIGEYQNGNCNTKIYDDGTKTRETEEECFSPVFPESMDIKITNYCNMGCPFCHENSTTDGLHGDILRAEFIDSLMPFTELAIGGGNPISHPDLIPFLQKLKQKNIVASFTLNQKHFLENQQLVESLVSEKLIYGIGVSLTKATPGLIKCLKKFPNAVLHVINGIVDIKDLQELYGKGFKVLILGYKTFRRGAEYYSESIEKEKTIIYNELPNIIKNFSVVSFDNLAIKQLKVKRLMSEEKWNEFYMGDDGQFTMYVDMVNQEFARSSVSEKRYKNGADIIEMFDTIRSEARAS